MAPTPQPRPSHGLGPVEPHLANDGGGTSFNPLLKVVPNPGHARPSPFHHALGYPRPTLNATGSTGMWNYIGLACGTPCG